ncbi:MAG: allantoinase AllB [Gemmatimonadaceae bacterium]
MSGVTVFRGRRVVRDGGVAPASVHVEDGVIARVGEPDDLPAGAAVVDVGDDVLMAGIVDTHVHVNEPGRAEWEGFDTATRAAAAGGVTTILDMPLNSIPATTSCAALDAKRRAADGRCWVDVGFIGGVVPGNQAALGPLHDAGVLAFKCFLVPSGVPEFEHVTESDLRSALPVLARLDALLMVHAELPRPIEAALAGLAGLDPHAHETWRRSRPPQSETEAVRMLGRLGRAFGTRVHVVHLSSREGVGAIHDEVGAGADLSAETCPHYLHFVSESVPAGATQFKCAPPIRTRDDREALWAALRDDVLCAIVSDHSPAPPEIKLRGGDFFAAWGGIASLELGLAAAWTEARARGHGPADVARWMCEAPARLVGLRHRKGRIAEGFDADFCVWRPDGEVRVVPEHLQQRHKLTPYAGETLLGRVEATYLAGRLVYERGELRGAPRGRHLLRDAGVRS